MIAPNSTIDIGSLQVGTSAPEGFCLVNNGTSTITVTALTVIGADFSATGNVLPLVLQPNAASPVVIGFTFAPTSAGVRTAQMSLVDDASGSPQMFTLSGTGFTDFGLNTLVPGDNTQTVTAGQIADYAMLVEGASIPPGPAFSGLVSFSCSNLPQGASCNFSPASALLPQNAGNFGLAVSTTARPAASLHKPDSKFWYALAAIFALVLGASRRRFSQVGLVLCFILMAFVISCGGGSTKVPPGPTPAGTFPFSVNASSNGVTHSKSMVLVVK